MNTYEIINPITLHSGIVKLSDEQAKHRLHKLEAIKGKSGHYKITGPNQFKAGEVIGYDGDIPKGAANDMEELSAKRKAEEARKAEEETKHKAEEEETKRKAEEESKKNS